MYLEANKTYSLRYVGSNNKYAILYTEADSFRTDIYGGRIYTPTESGYYYIRVYMSDNLTSVGDSATVTMWIHEGDANLPYEPYFSGLRDAKVTEVKSVGVNKWSGEISSKTAPTIYSFENGTLKLTRNGGAIQGCVWSKEKYKAGTYTVSFDASGVSGVNFGLCTIKETSASTGSSIKVWFTNGKQTYTFTLAEDRYIGFFTDGSGVTITASNLIINEGNTALPYSPYTEYTLAIPESVQSLEGYGQSNPDNANEYNYLDLINQQFVTVGHIVNGVWEANNSTTDIDIPDIIGVEGGGTLIFENEYGYDVPSEVFYQLEGVAE